ncbi:hypothetical protein [Hymenobacter psoromatis]|uniref:hypothetical protein n=1 Tax=Hymenobacter psoromatis TaxID=1484116 RepID=UPI001CC0B0D4|nr:hypothetical protein [Hymenobacter psoromatis]
MKKLSSLRELFNELEQLAEDQQGHIIGGFAAINTLEIPAIAGDNDHTGNCAVGCGSANATCL